METEEQVVTRIVGISGNVKAPSRTSALVAALLGEIEQRIGIAGRHIDLAQSAPALFRALRADQLDDEGLEIVRAVETADILVVASPVYRASYTGALKHLFDLVDYRSLTGKPVINAATGGNPLHGLMPDTQLRPLFAFFRTLTLSTSIYALESDFEGYAVSSAHLEQRIKTAADELANILGRATHAVVDFPAAATAATRKEGAA
jgi:FMN reductase